MPDSTPDPATLRERELFLAALDLAGAERQQFLDAECGESTALRHRLDALLADHPDAPTLMDTPLLLPEKQPRPGDAIGYFGDYVLLDEIARGGAGVVFRARQTTLNRTVALKMLRDRPLLTSDAELRRFRAEAEAIASLDHPHIVPIHEVGAHDGQAYFSMKLIEGGTLQFRAAEFAAPRRAAALMAKVARAVHHAHQQGLVHRDIKPGNILLDAAVEPHVSDFGLARRMDADSGLTISGQIMGTPHYMAPEQARGENRQITPAADIYSLGAVLYELLAGQRPFAGEDFVTVIKQVTETTPPPLRSVQPGLPRDLETIVHKCLEKAPSARYATAEALAEDLDRWQRGEPIHARPVSLPERLIKWARRRPGHAAAAAQAVLLAATLGIAAMLLSRPHQPDPSAITRSENAAPLTPLPGADADGWVNLLTALDPPSLKPAGTWRLTPDGLHCAPGEVAFLEFPCPLPDEFDYETDFTVRAGSHVHVSQFFPTPLPDHAVMLRHADGGITLGPNIDGQTTGQPAIRNGDWSALAGARCRSRVEVRRAAIRVLFNDEPVLQWSGDFRRLAPENWRRPRDLRHPCLLVQTTDVTFHSVKVRAATGLAQSGTFLRRPAVGEPGSLIHTLTSPDWKWEGPFNLGAGVNGPDRENQPSLTADGLELFFQRVINGSDKLYTARRTRPDEPFGPAQPVAELTRLIGWEAAPFITPDGLTLYYADDGPSLGKPETHFDLAMTRRRDRQSPWEKPVIAPISLEYADSAPSLSADGLTLVFASGEPSAIHVSRRASVHEAFTTVSKLTGSIESTAKDYSPYLCADGRTLLFSRRAAAGSPAIHVTLLDGTATTHLAKLDLPAETLDGPHLSPDGLTLYAGAYHPESHGLMDLCTFRRIPEKAPGSAVRPGGP